MGRAESREYTIFFKVQIGVGMSVFIIAEAGVNHNGDIALAKELIDVAVDAGVDAVKFQTWKTELLVTKEAKQAAYQTDNTGVEESQYDMLKKLELSYIDFRELKAYCDEREILFLSTPDEPTSADFLKELQNIFKIGSGELTNIPFLRHIGAFKKNIILSTGMGTLGEIEKAIMTLISSGTPKEQITLLHATTMYPTPMNEVNLKAMLTLKEAFKIKVGYSDHTMGIEVPIAAVAMGASVIEKHFTLSRDMDGPDHQASLEPQELKAMVQAIRNIECALVGTGEKIPQHSEIKNKEIVRKSIVAKTSIKKGELFTVDNLDTKRVGSGISSLLWDEVIGTTATKAYHKDELI
jgi:N-acetylneuraminate synthase